MTSSTQALYSVPRPAPISDQVGPRRRSSLLAPTFDQARGALAADKKGADTAALGKAGKAFGVASDVKSAKETALEAKAKSFDPITMTGVPVSFSGGADSGWQGVTPRPGYRVVVEHGGAIGEGLRGVDKKVGDALGKEGAEADIFDDISAKLDLDTTQTAMTTTSKGLEDLDPKTETASWKAGQHHPCDPAETPGLA